MITKKHNKAKNISSDLLSSIAVLQKQIESFNTILDNTQSEEYAQVSYIIFPWEVELKRIRKKSEKLEKLLYHKI
jgi:hypothetical protein